MTATAVKYLSTHGYAQSNILASFSIYIVNHLRVECASQRYHDRTQQTSALLQLPHDPISKSSHSGIPTFSGERAARRSISKKGIRKFAHRFRRWISWSSIKGGSVLDGKRNNLVARRRVCAVIIPVLRHHGCASHSSYLSRSICLNGEILIDMNESLQSPFIPNDPIQPHPTHPPHP